MIRPGDADGPIRTCVGCRERHPQTRLLRCVFDGATARVDRTAPGRGAWICGAACLDGARRQRGFDRAWRTPVPVEALDGLRAQLEHALDHTAPTDLND